jgi:hypothetical protein
MCASSGGEKHASSAHRDGSGRPGENCLIFTADDGSAILFAVVAMPQHETAADRCHVFLARKPIFALAI